MILVLSCFDLAVVTITHPLLITSTIYYSFEDVRRQNETWENIRIFVSFMLSGVSLTALLTLNGERFLALTCPYFHQRSVTKTKLVYFQAFSAMIVIGVAPLIFSSKTAVAFNIFIALALSLLLFIFVCGNYKLLIIAKSKRRESRIAPSTVKTTDSNRKSRILNLKNISTCSLAVGCYFVCSAPQVLFSFFRFKLGTRAVNDQFLMLFLLWSNTFVSINSTLNSLIFFWRNSILRREGTKLINVFRGHIFIKFS